MNTLELQLLIDTQARLGKALHGEKAAVVATACEQLGCSAQTLYRKLDALAGTVPTARKARKDAGAGMYSRAHLAAISGLLVESTRKNGKQLMSVAMAVEVLVANGVLPSALSAGHVGQQLRAATLHPDQLNHATPAQSLRTEHPNQLWQIDASVCTLYYIKSASDAGHELAAMPANQFYKNKPQNLAAVADKLAIRYACTDHTSGTIWVRYYTGGETCENLIEFFFWCIGKREGSPAHGVPLQLMLDPGSANTSAMFVNLLQRLHVKLIVNEAGNPRAKGQVEQAHNIIERQFEARLKFMTKPTLEKLNGLCERWQAAFNSTAVHSRHEATRFANWLRITASQLRIAPPAALLRELVVSTEQTRRVSNTMTISFSVKTFGSADYDVRYVPGVMAGQTVVVVVNAYRAPAVDVRYTEPETGEVCWLTVEPIALDSNGFVATAPIAGERFAQPPMTVADHSRQELGRAAFPHAANDDEVARARKRNEPAYLGAINPMADVDATVVPLFINKRGTALEPEARSAAERVLSVAEACMRLKALMGEDYSTAIYAHLRAEHGDKGVPEAALAGVMDRFGPSAPAAPMLRVVGGGL